MNSYMADQQELAGIISVDAGPAWLRASAVAELCTALGFAKYLRKALFDFTVSVNWLRPHGLQDLCTGAQHVLCSWCCLVPIYWHGECARCLCLAVWRLAWANVVATDIFPQIKTLQSAYRRNEREIFSKEMRWAKRDNSQRPQRATHLPRVMMTASRWVAEYAKVLPVVGLSYANATAPTPCARLPWFPGSKNLSQFEDRLA
jgi:hypothetical protein